jgi:protein-disulfide isomerase
MSRSSETKTMNDEMWVSQKMSTLTAAQSWRPDEEIALRSLRERKRAQRLRRIRLVWGALAAGVALGALIGITAPRACAEPNGCHAPVVGNSGGKRPAARVAVPNGNTSTASTQIAQRAAPAPSAGEDRASSLAMAAARSGAPPSGQAFKQTGPAHAPVVIEIYSDYECPACAHFFQTELPVLTAYYGPRLRLIHRDFPLPRHAYAKLAARYANAAGMLGYYQLAVNQIFKTQPVWSADGSIDAQVASALPSEVMQRVRELVRDEASMDRLLEPDVAMAKDDAVQMTPSMVVVANGVRHLVAPIGAIIPLEAYLNAVTGQPNDR